MNQIMNMQSYYHAIFFTAFHLTRALTAPIQRDSLFYWPFLISTLVIALAALAYWKQRGIGSEPGRFGKALWWHRSARADYRLYFVNALLLPAFFGLMLFNQHDVVAWLDRLLGYSGHAAVSSSLAWKFVYTLVFFIAYDFGRFVAHSMLHDIPILWEFHKVHHSAQVLTPMTAYRAHPVDLLVMAWGGTIAVGLVSWGFNHLAGAVVDAYLFLGLHVLIWISNLIGNLRHMPVWMTYGPALGKWLVSPAHHQLHHSCEERHLGCNRGFDLAIWDRLYGTLYVPAGPEEEYSIGLDDGTTEEWQTVRQMLFRPFAGAARIVLDSGRRRLNVWR